MTDILNMRFHAREDLAFELAKYLTESTYADRFKSLYQSRYGRNLDNPHAFLMFMPISRLLGTMNTLDQSLFPMDSAFRRRWAWSYIPIRYPDPDRIIEVNGKQYSWNSFLHKINDLIYKLLETEDKCLGPFFIKSEVVSESEFRNKVLFYI